MSLRRPRRPQLQQLEDRATPAVTTTFLGGLLTIKSDNLSNTITISEVGTTGNFTVTDKVGAITKTVGTFKIANLMITTGNGNDVVDLRINSKIAGYVNVFMGNGSDFFTTANTPVVTPPTARIGGNLLINLGLGNRLGVTALLGQAYDQAVLLSNLKVGGNMTVLGSPGSGAELVSISNSIIGGNLHTINIYQTSLGSLIFPTPPVTVGSVTVSNYQKNTDSRTDTYVGPGNDLFFLNGVTCLGNVTYTGGNGQDSVELPGDPGTSTPAFIGGSVFVNTGEGPSTLSLGTGIINGAGAQIAGNVQYSAGSGVDRFFLDSGANVAGSVYVNLGEGNNQFLGNSDPTYPRGNEPPPSPRFAAFMNGTVAGSMTLIAGNGDNYLSQYGGGVLTVAGNLNVQFGNGDNVGGNPLAPGAITFFNTALLVGGTATYQAGTGTNNLTITNETIADLRLRFTGGPTTALFTQASTMFNGKLLIDFGTGFGPKTLGGTASFEGPTTILNY